MMKKTKYPLLTPALICLLLLNACQISSVPKYDRNEWQGWHTKKCLNTRHRLLKNQSIIPVKLNTKGCQVLEGEWIDFYAGVKITMKDKPEIDHVVPVKHVHMHGGHKWTRDKKRRFYNDKENLVITSKSLNAQKGDNDFVNWHPADRKRSCMYANKWINVKNKYNLKYSKQECSNFRALEEKKPCPQKLPRVLNCPGT